MEFRSGTCHNCEDDVNEGLITTVDLDLECRFMVSACTHPSLRRVKVTSLLQMRAHSERQVTDGRGNRADNVASLDHADSTFLFTILPVQRLVD